MWKLSLLFSGFDQKASSINLHWLHPVLSFKIIMEVKCVLKHHISSLSNLTGVAPLMYME